MSFGTTISVITDILSNTTQTPIIHHNGIRNSVLGVTLLITNILIIILNFITILVISRFRHKNAIDIFVFTLAVADLIKGLVPVPMTTFIYMTDWYLKQDRLECNFFGWIAFATNSGAMLILTLMSIERFWAVAHPFSYRKHVTLPRVKRISMIAMAFSALHSATPVFGVGRMLPYYEGAYSHFDYSRYSKGTIAYSMFIICYGYGMLLIVMIMYSFVFYKIRNLIHRHRRMSVYQRRGTNENGLNLQTEKMFSYLTLALMVLFMIGWLPFLIVVFTSQLNQSPPNERLDLFAMRMAVITSLLNPIACATLCKPYRRGILYYFRMVASLCGFKKPDSDIWDPWRRRKSTISRNDRDKALQDNKRKQSTSEYAQNSLTDIATCSVYPNTTDYEKHRIPSTLETYDEFLHKEPTVNFHDETYEDETTSNNQKGAKNTRRLLVHRSMDSGIEGSPSILRTTEEKRIQLSINKLDIDGDTEISKRRSFLGKVQNLFVKNETNKNEENALLINKLQTTDVDHAPYISPSNAVLEQYKNATKQADGLDRYSVRFTPEELVNALNDVIAKQSLNNIADIKNRSENTDNTQNQIEFEDFTPSSRVRCFSEGRKQQNDHIKPIKLKDIVHKELEDSQSMINRIKKELTELENLEKTEYNNRSGYTNGTNFTRNTVCF